MLTIADGGEGISRRGFITAGSLGLGGLTLSSLLSARAMAAGSEGFLRDRSVIFLFMQGGPSQYETFDPKLDIPDKIRTATGVTQTSLPGVIFGDRFPQLAERAHRLTVVRSYQTNNGGHNIQPLVGPASLEGNIGTHFARVVGATRPATGVPTTSLLFPQSVNSEVTKGRARGNLAATGEYGDVYAPFQPGVGGQLQKDMRLNLPRARFLNDRRSLLAALDQLHRKMDVSDRIETSDALQQQAADVLLGGGVSEALDLSKEDPNVTARYDTSRYAARHNWAKVNRGKSGYYTGHAKSLGKLLLLARRLCETGCGFVTVHAGYAGVWDNHADGNNLGVVDGMDAVGRTFDHAVAAFMDDVEARGLKDKILLVCSGEMGRGRGLSRNGGRGHWGPLAPLLLYGGGIPDGQVIGKSTRDGAEPESDNLTPKHLIATIMNTLFDVGQLRLERSVPPAVLQLAQADPIPDLF